MNAAAWPRPDAETRLLHVDAAAEAIADLTLDALPALLRRGDLVVLNDAATLPASLRATVSGAPGELRLAAQLDEERFCAVLFGAGDFRTLTEDRSPPPRVRPGDRIGLEDGLAACVLAVDPRSPRLVEIALLPRGPVPWPRLYRIGRPVQYAYVREPLPLYHVQTAWASRPWAMETPSAGRALDLGRLAALRARGVAVARLTHAAGLSSTGDPAIDALLPFPERYEIPEATVQAIARARGRVIAVGTTVARALEGCARAHGRLVAGRGTTDLRLGPGSRLAVVDGIVTGLHERAGSHFRLLQAFAPAALLDAAYGRAEAAGYLMHEFGDACLITRR